MSNFYKSLNKDNDVLAFFRVSKVQKDLIHLRCVETNDSMFNVDEFYFITTEHINKWVSKQTMVKCDPNEELFLAIGGKNVE